MPKLSVNVPNHVGKEEALKRLKNFSAALQEKFKDRIKDMEETWDGDQGSFGFKTAGMKIGGTLSVADDNVTVAGDLPFAAMIFKGRIEQEIQKSIEKALA